MPSVKRVMRVMVIAVILVIAAIFTGYWLAGGLWMAGLGVGMLRAGLSAHPDAFGFAMILLFFALFCLPLALLACLAFVAIVWLIGRSRGGMS